VPPCDDSDPATCATNEVCISGTCVTPILIEDPNNYSATSRFDIPVIETAAGVDLTICYGEVETDLSCSEVDPQTDVDAVALLVSRTSSSEAIGEMLSSGELDMSNIHGYLFRETDHQSTCTELSSLSNFGVPVNVGDFYVENADHGYLFMVSRGTSAGSGTVSMVLAKPVSSSMNTRIDLPSGCDLHEMTADLESAVPVRFAYETQWIVDYGRLTRDALDNPFMNNVDGLVLSFFAGATLSELETHLMDLDAVATESFDLQLTGSRVVSLHDARSRETGEAFAGFRRADAGVWLFRLTCSFCTNPMPPVIAVFEPF
jgi:hypothetical protein